MGQIKSAEAGASGGAVPSASRLRADARRNSEQIRAAAIGAFQGRGLTVPLEDVAKAAGVSKATIFNRFGGRIGLIEAVIEEVVATELFAVIDHARTIADAGERTAYYLTALRDLQYRQPAVNDVLLQTYPHSQQLMEICRAGSEANTEIVAAARANGALRPEFTAGDLHALVVDTALALKHGPRPPRDEYDRRTTYLLDGIRGPRPTPG
ncbi:TetR family transcriptional regulator [Streptomyces chrestomyceticus JCM 4735]|uniref:TetR family transcriptional regulator n=1 Tax=Streptomyces chrestomyceticus JCM 4735 TaxID=1306181 RepID=A0A7U9PY68_9ACTN|nr:TetR/AcrR family transcriptional regulator [Streptomyces chrestomyceticus]GCD32919.1 TetR family transcriptional regulator [Streptomyces chrestomyceticus JCM 4735]